MPQSELKDPNLSLPGVISVNKKNYAVNLLWNEVPDDKNYRAVIKSRLKLLGSDLFAISRNLTGRQYAIADKNIGHRKKQFALASCIDNNGRSFCALCQYDSIWILLAVDRNGCVVVDKASYDQDEIIQTFYSTYTHIKWDDVVCPAELGIPDTSEQSVFSLINKKGVRLCPAGVERFYPLAGVGSVCVVCAVLAVVFQDVIKPEEEKPAITVESAKPQEIEVPWGGYSFPSEFIKLCVDDVSRYYLRSSSIPGWNVGPVVVCDDEKGKMSLTVTKDFGLRIWLTEEIYKKFLIGDLPEIKISSDDKSADILWPLRTDKYKKIKLQQEQLKSELKPVGDVKKYIQDTFESYFIPLQLESESSVDGGIKKISFRISLQNEPTIVLPILADISNLVINKCVFDAGRNTWEVQGTFWGK